MSTYYGKTLGRYNFAGSEKQWQLYLYTPFGNVSELWDEDEEPDADDILPSEVLDMIEAKLKRWWICTGREQKQATIEAIRDHKNEIDLDWLESQAVHAEKKAAKYRKRREWILSEIEDEAA